MFRTYLTSISLIISVFLINATVGYASPASCPQAPNVDTRGTQNPHQLWDICEYRPKTNRKSGDFGIGILGNIEGLQSIGASYFLDDNIAAFANVGIYFNTITLEIAWLSHDLALTPLLGAGVNIVADNKQRFGKSSARYKELYRLGTSANIRLGGAYRAFEGLDLQLSMVLITPINQDDPDSVVMFPELSFGLYYYF